MEWKTLRSTKLKSLQYGFIFVSWELVCLIVNLKKKTFIDFKSSWTVFHYSLLNDFVLFEEYWFCVLFIETWNIMCAQMQQM